METIYIGGGYFINNGERHFPVEEDPVEKNKQGDKGNIDEE